MYYRARHYNPTWGRFVSEDPIGIAGGTNLYLYAEQNPVNLTDPSGEANPSQEMPGIQTVPRPRAILVATLSGLAIRREGRTGSRIEIQEKEEVRGWKDSKGGVRANSRAVPAVLASAHESSVLKGRRHVKLRETEKCRYGRFLGGGGRNGFPFRHRLQTMKVG